MELRFRDRPLCARRLHSRLAASAQDPRGAVCGAAAERDRAGADHSLQSRCRHWLAQGPPGVRARHRHLARCPCQLAAAPPCGREVRAGPCRSEEHTSELQSLMRISYAVFCLKTKTKQTEKTDKT